MLIIGRNDVLEILNGTERELIDLVGRTYRLHDEGRTAVPFSTFLRFPEQPADRIIALPAFVGGDDPAAGMKWIASFPGNLADGLDRASAAILLNSLTTGRPQAVIEGSVISARRTAASAALAADLLLAKGSRRGVTLFGCGVINLEVLRFLRVALPELAEVNVFDTDPRRARDFVERCRAVAPGVEVTVSTEPDQALGAHDLVSVATTAAQPHLSLAPFRPGAVVLHISLRDFHPEAILAAGNVVDDADHVCRERTSLHLAEQLVGDRRFVTGEIGALLPDPSGVVRDPDQVLIYSPFGLGALDIAVAAFVFERARRAGLGLAAGDFLSGGASPAPLQPMEL